MKAPVRVGGGVFWQDANWLVCVNLLHVFAHTDVQHPSRRRRRDTTTSKPRSATGTLLGSSGCKPISCMLRSNTARPPTVERSGRLGYVFRIRLRTSGVKLLLATW